MEDRTNILAQSALYADTLVYMGIEKSLAVLTQSDAMLGATLEACGATATVLFVFYVYHSRLSLLRIAFT